MPDISPAAVSELTPTGKLRVGINMSNFLLTRKDAATGEPAGVAVDLGRELGRRLGLPVEIIPYPNPGALADAAKSDVWDVGFLGAEPQRANEIDFTAAYVEIEATYLVPPGSSLRSIGDVDREGIRIAVPTKSAYELYLTRSLKHAKLVHEKGADNAFKRFVDDKLDALAGLKPRLVTDHENLPGSRILDGNFTAVQQAVGTPKGRKAGAQYLREFVEDIKATGLVARTIEKKRRSRSHRRGVDVAHAFIQNLAHVFSDSRGAGRPAGCEHFSEAAVDRFRHDGRFGIARVAHRLRQIRRADEEHVDIVDFQQLVDIVDRGLLFELNGDQRRIVRGFDVIGQRAVRIVNRGACSGSEAALSQRMVFDRRDDVARILGCVDMRHLHAHHAAVEHLQNVLGTAGRRPRDRRDAAGFRRHRHQLDALERERAVLAVEQHPVEAGGADHFDDLRRRDHHRHAEDRLARAQLLLHSILFHLVIYQFARMFAALMIAAATSAWALT